MRLDFDIGANKGDYTAWLLASGSDRVIAVEANKKEAEKLEQRFSGLTIRMSDGSEIPRVVVVNKAVSDTLGPPIDFYVCPECDGISTTDEFWRTQSRFSMINAGIEGDASLSGYRTWVKESVEVITIDKLVMLYGEPKHIKIDIEGSENKAIRGMNRDYGMLQFEWVEEKLDEIIQSVLHLAKIGYHLFGALHGDQPDLMPGQFMDAAHTIRFLKQVCIPERKKLWGMLYCCRTSDFVWQPADTHIRKQ